MDNPFPWFPALCSYSNSLLNSSGLTLYLDKVLEDKEKEEKREERKKKEGKGLVRSISLFG